MHCTAPLSPRKGRLRSFCDDDGDDEYVLEWQQNKVRGVPIKNNPLGKIYYPSYCNTFFHQIYSFHRGGFRPCKQQISLQYLLWYKNHNYLNLKVHFSKWTRTKLRFLYKKIIANLPYGYANGLLCVGCNAETLSKTHAKAGQHNTELKDRFVDDTEWFASQVHR